MDFQIGDTVKFEGTIVHEGGDVYAVQSSRDESYNWISKNKLELVSRPEPTYTLELTATQIEILRDGVYSLAEDSNEASAAKALDAVLDRIVENG